jgi:hypothetical protein
MKRDPSDRTANVLLLTATITPPAGVPSLARIDPDQRLQDYEQALAFYLPLVGRCIDEIIVAENSSSDISSLRALAECSGLTDQVEFLVFDGLDHPVEYGRGYGEFRLIDHVMAHSRVVQTRGSPVTIWKVTGRYIVRNLCRIIERRPRAFDLYCNVRNWPRRWADMYLLAWSAAGYKALIRGSCEQLKETENRGSPEVRFRDLVESAAVGLKVIPRFTITPLIEGVRGLDNRAYSRGRNLLKFYLRSAMRRTAPWLWV